MKPVRALTVIFLLALATGCAVLPPRSVVAESRAISDGAATTLGQTAAASIPTGFASAFQLLPVASAAYEARLALANQAERSIDVQAFYWGSDNTGTYLLNSLRAAAARGVRVRLLVDDLNTSGSDELLAGFARDPNVEVRLFNPFPAGRSSVATRYLASLDDFTRLNHRMHNKLLVVDNALAIFGGRNTGDEYFMRATGGNFVDFDVLAAGHVVQDLSGTFDVYWNSPYAYPVGDIVKSGSAEADALFREALRAAEQPVPDETFPIRYERYMQVPNELSAGRLTLTGGEASVVADPTDKVLGRRMTDRSGTVREQVAEAVGTARHDVLIVSPYFVPGELGMNAMRKLRAKGVSLRLLTNSLASTDEPSVHAGYRRYRHELLQQGVEVYELSPTLAQRARALGRFGSSFGMLHAKLAAIDHRLLFVGSMNLDTRSERYNTELGVLIDSKPLTEDFLDLTHFESSAYRLRLDSGGRTQWVEGEGVHQQVLTDEPEASWWLRLKSFLLGDVVPEGWL